MSAREHLLHHVLDLLEMPARTDSGRTERFRTIREVLRIVEGLPERVH